MKLLALWAASNNVPPPPTRSQDDREREEAIAAMEEVGCALRTAQHEIVQLRGRVLELTQNIAAAAAPSWPTEQACAAPDRRPGRARLCPEEPAPSGPRPPGPASHSACGAAETAEGPSLSRPAPVAFDPEGDALAGGPDSGTGSEGDADEPTGGWRIQARHAREGAGQRARVVEVPLVRGRASFRDAAAAVVSTGTIDDAASLVQPLQNTLPPQQWHAQAASEARSGSVSSGEGDPGLPATDREEGSPDCCSH
jgi:hypothetical protein